MKEAHVLKIASELSLKLEQVQATAKLIDEGGTVPFIARYRKEATGTLDEVQITNIRDRLTQLAELDTRREAIIKSLEERQLLTPELKKAVDGAETMTRLEDIYLPHRPKRRTRATIAKEKGLEPLATFLLENQDASVEAEPEKFVNKEKEVETTEDALAGARDIIAEHISDHPEARAKVRELFLKKGELTSEVIMTKEEEGAKYRDYFDWKEPLEKAPSHRVLAIRRGEKEGFLYTRITPPEETVLATLKGIFVKGNGDAGKQVAQAAEDSYKRLLGPSLETEARLVTKKKADEEAIRVFTENMRELLLAPALGQKRVIAIDPGFRTGCKVVCLDAQGKLLHHDVIYCESGPRQRQEAETKLHEYVVKYDIEAIAIGNGTASRETESFVRSIGLPKSIAIIVVNESGASIYSASEAAREEFPNEDITVRGSVSIGRRLMDPLAELVKIDPKSIGVGQYQHDVNQSSLKRSLDDVVVSCVNKVGVEVNTSSWQLLSYVSGLNGTIAKKIVEHRNENGPFSSRKELTQVSRLGPKAFEQAAGFLRIRDAEHPLDASAVHPESYGIVEKMATDLDCTVTDLMKSDSLRKKLKLEDYVTETVGLPTLKDIVDELAKPGRDPRERFEVFEFTDGVNTIEDLKEGQKLPGIVTNVTAFGAFVDIGVHQDGLVHISQLADVFVKDPNDVVKVQQKVTVTVTEVDVARKRIGLSMKTVADNAPKSIAESNKSKGPRGPKRPHNKGSFKQKNQSGHNNKQRNNRQGGDFNSLGDIFDSALK